jgi:DNA polymerase III delta prime subunit
MLELPLHHCYLIPADDPATALIQLRTRLKELFNSSQTELFVEANFSETFTIDDARELRERGQQKATAQARCLLRGFEIATTPAQNAILKIIEAPAEGIHFFFVTPQPNNLLETVRSRAVRLDDFSPQSIDENMAELVKAFSASDALVVRLEITAKLETIADLRQFVRALAASEAVRTQEQLGAAVERVADWSRDSGASVKLLGQYLAIAANQSTSQK